MSDAVSAGSVDLDSAAAQRAAAPPKLEIRNLSIAYQRRDDVGAEIAVQNVGFDIAPQEFICIVGPSGCGIDARTVNAGDGPQCLLDPAGAGSAAHSRDG